jgi:hypothetical protein
MKLPGTTVFLASLIVLPLLAAQGVAVRHREGRSHGFLVLRDDSGRQIGGGEMTEETEGDRVTCRVLFRFKDGSVDDETTVYSQRGSFQLVGDRHIQRGPFFSRPLDLTTDAGGQMTIRSEDKVAGKPKEEVSHMDMEPGTAVDGMMPAIMANLDPLSAALKLPMLSPTRRPRFFHFDVKLDGKGSFTVAGMRRTATIFRLHTDLGGLAGVVAPLVGKEPKDMLVWVIEGDAPAIVRVIGQLAEGSPLVDIQMAGTSFPRGGSR